MAFACCAQLNSRGGGPARAAITRDPFRPGITEPLRLAAQIGAMNIVAAGRLRLLITALTAAAALTACTPGSHSSAGTPTASGTQSQPSAASSPHASTEATSSAASSVSDVDVCSLLTAAQASSINKVTYGAGAPKRLAANYDECTYPNKGSADPVDIQALDVDVLTFGACWAGLQTADGPGTPVSGLGDAAFGYEIGLDVHAGSRCIAIRGLTHAELNGDHSSDVALAKIVLAGLH